MSISLTAPTFSGSFATQPGLGELVSSRDVSRLLDTLLEHVISDCRAACGAIFFAGPPAIRIRKGDWSKKALLQLSKWEGVLATELERHSIYLEVSPPPSETRLDDEKLGLLVNAPLRSGTEVVGSLTLAYAAGASPPKDYQTGISHAAANIGSLASLLHEIDTNRHKLTQLELFYQIGQRMVSILDLNRLLTSTTSIVTSILNAGAASLMLIDEERQELVFEIALGEKRAALHHTRIPLNQGIAGWVATHGEPVIVNDPARDKRFTREIDARTGFLTHSIICVPLQIKGKTIGVLEVLNKYSGKGFDEEDLQILMTIAGQAAIAIENARLYYSLQQERDKIISAQEEVRRELARNLHDGIVQLLAAISMNIDHIERLLRFKPEAVLPELEALRQLTNQASRQARLLLFELRPVILESRGLVAALEFYVQQLSSTEEFTVHLDTGNFAGRLDPKIEGTVFSILQEAVNNIKRHAKARQVWLRLKLEPTLFQLEVEDDGVGFHRTEVEKHYDQRGSFGLLNMRERAALLDGTLEIESLSEGRERGTLVRLKVPLTQKYWAKPPIASEGAAGSSLQNPEKNGSA